jgi:apolipoprotein D and lipocalin family protein
VRVTRGLKALLRTLFCSALFGCAGIPDGVQAVRDFRLEPYLGTWYEIARLDNRFERGLSDITARYGLADKGSIVVHNRGWSLKESRWKEVTGKAKPVGEPGEGRLKVSFFGPFYAGYNVIALGPGDPQWALVCGNKRSYLWILARRPYLEDEIYADLVGRAAALGFDTGALVRVDHTRAPAP